jgi:hypothetical protein
LGKSLLRKGGAADSTAAWGFATSGFVVLLRGAGAFARSKASSLNSDSRATDVTWFVRARGIALHYFPSVPKYTASHGCVRLEEKRVAQLIQSNSRIDLTNVVVDGVWTKPRKQW